MLQGEALAVQGDQIDFWHVEVFLELIGEHKLNP